MNRAERFGKIIGYILGGLTALVSFIRSSRMFHPNGLLFEAHVKSTRFPEHAMIRLSGAWWKENDWPDALGIAIRFSHHKFHSVIPKKEDQDLLFVSFSEAWQTPFSPFITDQKDFLKNEYFSVGNFEVDKKSVRYKLIPIDPPIIKGPRSERIMEAVIAGGACFSLCENGKEVAVIKLLRTFHFDQEALRFNPFLNGLGIKPRGFLQYLRIGTYRLSQWARPDGETPP